ncbi:hypothetical protein CHGG_01929 [Chaetomium globosum CBS 148.51]|uniref:Uncharacterized protein n=1 Tax=Chaetomium globosum (strain ATCC 6205 / CBS 148.51 / DSM 1962 / NBRC 6347 / NRRL 1970) TaxID=306901 RepID=Q2HCX5_CHAGB|nr:uncharacterized protein CHGG_01929 [Chaetomium globosum CBS 148.51]EAQ93694.1 hypothetical protein CHGG_01929 [Chaetomium globosum CBS 148.51]
MASVGSGQSGTSVTKITKARGKMVKPILKRLSHSEKNSLDLDRGWDEQQIEQLTAGGMGGWVIRGRREMSVLAFLVLPVSGQVMRWRRWVGEVPSEQTSSFNTVVPVLKLRLEADLAQRDCAPATGLGASPACFQRPSLNGHRASSFPDTPASKPPSLRINTSGRSVSGTTATSSRLAHGNIPSPSHSELNLDSYNLSISLSGTLDSPTGSLGAGSVIASPQQQQSQLSPLRASLDMGVFPNLRRSELDTATRDENIRVARRKFEEREREKEEKYDREMIRKRERQDNKEASRIEKGEAPSRPLMHRKKTATGLSTVSEPGPKSARPDLSTSLFGFSAPARTSGVVLGVGKRRHTDSPTMTKGEKQVGFASRRYESVSLLPQTPPSFGVTVDDMPFERPQPRRGSGAKSAKQKTQGYWQGFLLWLRTKLLRMNSR